MELKIIKQSEDFNSPMFGSENGTQLKEIYNEFYTNVGYHEPWVAYSIIHQDELVGTCSFVGQPIEGRVELSYWTFPAFESQGVASFACGSLISIAKQENPDIIIVAKTAPEYNASTKILQKNGFEFMSIVQDHEIGDAWLWKLN